jgi:hypothetical protein
LSTSLETNTLLDTANQEEQLTRDDYGYPEYEFTDADAPPEFGY